MASTKLESSPKLSTKASAVAELSVAGTLWGFGFIGTIWALGSLSPSAILCYRFAMAFAASFLILLIQKTSKADLKNELWLSLVPAIFLWLTLFTQTVGLKYTTATNSAFITTLYVVLVPVLRALSGAEKLHWQHWFCVTLAMVGTGFIVKAHQISALNWGDLLTLVCSIFAAVHILVVGQRALKTRNDFAFNAFQCFWVSLFSLFVFPFSQNWSLAHLDGKVWLGLLSLGFGSSMIAFYLQVRAQKVLSPSVASLLFLLESPSSCLFAYLLLNEQMNFWQWAGAIMILIACALISLAKGEVAGEAV